MINEMKKIYGKSNYISFSIEKEEKESNTGNLTIRLSMDIKDKDFPDQTATLQKEFNGFSARIGYSINKLYFSDPIYGSNGKIGAFFKLIKEGDELSFYYEDNVNQYCEKAIIPENCFDYNDRSYKGLHCDTLFVNIWRKGKSYLSNYELINNGPCPNNSTRAVRN